MIGLGLKSAQLKIYIANTPPIEPYNDLQYMLVLAPGNIQAIGETTGNHWRKIFNVFAKLVFTLNTYGFDTWQRLRDNYLLQEQSNESLIFSKPFTKKFENDKDLLPEEFDLSRSKNGVNNANCNNNSPISSSATTVHIVMGKTYANTLGLSQQCDWLSPDFAVNEHEKLIICPYFDYRQLSNIKIEKLAQLIKQLSRA